MHRYLHKGRLPHQCLWHHHPCPADALTACYFIFCVLWFFWFVSSFWLWFVYLFLLCFCFLWLMFSHCWPFSVISLYVRFFLGNAFLVSLLMSTWNSSSSLHIPGAFSPQASPANVFATWGAPNISQWSKEPQKALLQWTEHEKNTAPTPTNILIFENQEGP